MFVDEVNFEDDWDELKLFIETDLCYIYSWMKKSLLSPK